MIFIYISYYFTAREYVNSTNSSRFTAQLVEHRTRIAEVTGLSTVEALLFFSLLPSNCLNWTIYCDDHFSFSSTTVVQNMTFIYISRCNVSTFFAIQSLCSVVWVESLHVQCYSKTFSALWFLNSAKCFPY